MWGAGGMGGWGCGGKTHELAHTGGGGCKSYHETDGEVHQTSPSSALSFIVNDNLAAVMQLMENNRRLCVMGSFLLPGSTLFQATHRRLTPAFPLHQGGGHDTD
jgi:hypothetical protein